MTVEQADSIDAAIGMLQSALTSHLHESRRAAKALIALGQVVAPPEVELDARQIPWSPARRAQMSKKMKAAHRRRVALNGGA